MPLLEEIEDVEFGATSGRLVLATLKFFESTNLVLGAESIRNVTTWLAVMKDMDYKFRGSCISIEGKEVMRTRPGQNEKLKNSVQHERRRPSRHIHTKLRSFSEGTPKVTVSTSPAYFKTFQEFRQLEFRSIKSLLRPELSYGAVEPEIPNL